MTKRDFNKSDLNEYFILNSEDHSEFLKCIDGEDEYYYCEEGIEGAEIFTREEIKELLNKPENENLCNEVDIISVKDAYEMINEDYKKYIVICQD